MGDESSREPVQYRDIWFRIILALIAAHIIVSFGETDDFFQLLLSWFYYRSLLYSFAIALILIHLVYFVTIKLDKHFDWQQKPIQRTGLQILFGLLAPGLCAFLLATGYFALFGYSIFKTRYLLYDFPLILVMLLLMNVYYLAFYFFRRWQQLSQANMSSKQAADETKKQVIVANRGAKNIPIPVDSICYFYHKEANFLRTFEKEDFVINDTLDTIERLLPKNNFFRVNRQMIVNFKSCKHYETVENQKLKLIVAPEIDEPIIISQRKAREFKEWVER